MPASAADSAASRPLMLERRHDLLIQEHRTARGREWIVKDPVAHRYAFLSDMEYALWQMLTGATTIEQLQEEFARRFAPQKLAIPRLQEFLIRLYRQGLIVSTSAGQGEQFALRARQRRWREMATLVPRLLAWRTRGIDPEAFLTRCYPWVRWLLHPLACAGWMLLIIAALTIVFVNWQELALRWPTMRELFQADNLLLLGIALTLVKALHELGHAFVCKHFGGEVRELGVMFLFGMPCLYCDVSDAWLFRRRRDRLAVSAAGMAVEVCLAAVATLVWATSGPGLLNSLCLNVMLVCGFGTLVLNGNPLMRYDGYYLLSDACEISNLDRRAQARLRRFAARRLLGIDLPNDQLGGGRATFVLWYAILSTAYRLALLIAVLMMLYGLLLPLRLDVIALFITALSLGGFFAMPLIEAAQQWQSPLMRRRLRPGRIALRLGALGAALTALVLVPLPYRVKAPAIVEARHTEYAYATVAGNIVESAAPGTALAAGETLARLENPDLAREIAKLQTEEQRLEVRLRNLEALRADDPTAAGEIPTTQKLLDDVRLRIAQQRADEQRLAIQASRAGIVVEAPRRPEAAGSELGAWSGTLLANANRGAQVEVGTLVALILDPAELDVVAVVDQADIALLTVGQPAQVYLRQRPGQRLAGTVMEISQMQVETPPPQLVGVGDILVQTSRDGAAQPATPAYQVRIALSGAPPHAVIGGSGTARITVAPQSIGARGYRYLRRTFGR